MLRKHILFLVLSMVIFITNSTISARNTIPVKGATINDWNPDSFWYYPWGRSIVHHGIDIFAKKGTSVLSSTKGIVIYKGRRGRAGNVIMVLGSWFKIHFYAHLDKINVKQFEFVEQGENIGTVGDSGNAKGKSPHLHYQIMTPVPYFWKADQSILGWRKIFFLNPEDFF